MSNVFHPASVQEYLDLCKMFNEIPHRKSTPAGYLVPDYLSSHALNLQRRAQGVSKPSPTKRKVVTPTYTNHIGQVIKLGDLVVCVSQGYNHVIKVRKGILSGISPKGNPTVTVTMKKSGRWDENGNEIGQLKRRFDPAIVSETRDVQHKICLPAGRVYKIDTTCM